MMKALTLLLLFASPVIVSIVQTPSTSQDSPDLLVLKSSWSKERIGWERDPFGGAVENFEEMRIRARNEKRIDDAKRSGNATEIRQAEREARADASVIASQRQKPQPARYVFRYKTSVKNVGTKTIRVVDWDYVFLDPDSEEEAGRHQFSSEQKISPGQNKELNVLISKPPASTVSVNSLGGRKDRQLFRERVVIVRVEYADGSVWQRP